MDPTIVAAAVVTAAGALAAAVVSVINANAAAKERVIAAQERKALKEAAETAAEKVKEVAEKAVGIAVRAGASDAKLDEVARSVDGNLTAVRAELTKASEANVALHGTVKSLQDTVTALTAILVETQKRASAPPATVAETVNVDADTVNVKKTPKE